IYEFTWNEYCDWYLELTKSILSASVEDDQKHEAQQRGTRHTLVNVLESLLRLSHPIMPYITEEIWQRVAPLAGIQQDTIMLQAFPQPDATLIDDNAVEEMQWLQQFVLGIRQIRSGYDIKPGKKLEILLNKGSEIDQQRVVHNEAKLKTLAKLESITWLDNSDNIPESATALVGNMQILIPMAGIIDVDAEKERLNKEIEYNQGFVVKLEGKLSNDNFVSRAPENVVAHERQKLADTVDKLKNLLEQLEKLNNI
ncbi:MAG: class I tRNA ligase family protein, partial [Thiotrichaceae bacterium]|nr:class I tRNA ligase family protein [Thiotrichaceae bacterium]